MNAKQIAERIVNKSGSYQEVISYAEGMISPLINRAEAAELRAAELEAQLTGLTAERDAAIDRFAQLEIDNDEMQSYINEIRVALHTEKDELTIEAVRRVVAERDAARLELQQIRTMLDDGDRDDFTALDMVKRLHAHDYALQRETWYSRM